MCMHWITIPFFISGDEFSFIFTVFIVKLDHTNLSLYIWIVVSLWLTAFYSEFFYLHATYENNWKHKGKLVQRYSKIICEFS
jgi:hypothetical protein